MMESSIQRKEFDDVARTLPVLGELNGQSVLITGATGLLGGQLAQTMLAYNRLFGKKIQVIVNGRNREKLHEIYGTLPVDYLISDIREHQRTDFPIDYIIHCASITSSQAFVKTPVDTIHTAITGTANILELARQKKVKGFLYTSSLEVYGLPPKFKVGENDYGQIDFLNVRSSYSESKRMVECLCKAYETQYGVPIKIARLTQTIGSGIDYNDNRVFAQFAKSVIERKNIILNTPGQTVRSYCDICDAVKAIITILLHGNVGEAYNVANKETVISIADMAQLVCDQNPEANIKVVFNTPNDISKLGYNPEMKISLDTSKLEKLGWHADVTLGEMFQKLITGLRENQSNE